MLIGSYSNPPTQRVETNPNLKLELLSLAIAVNLAGVISDKLGAKSGQFSMTNSEVGGDRRVRGRPESAREMKKIKKLKKRLKKKRIFK